MLAIGLVETKGLIGLVTAADAMVNAVNVEPVKRTVSRRWLGWPDRRTTGPRSMNGNVRTR
jgi:hypothetical protein